MTDPKSKIQITSTEMAAIMSKMPLNMAAQFTYHGIPSYLLLDGMTEDAQLHALRIIAECRGIYVQDE